MEQANVRAVTTRVFRTVLSSILWVVRPGPRGAQVRRYTARGRQRTNGIGCGAPPASGNASSRHWPRQAHTCRCKGRFRDLAKASQPSNLVKRATQIARDHRTRCASWSRPGRGPCHIYDAAASLLRLRPRPPSPMMETPKRTNTPFRWPGGPVDGIRIARWAGSGEPR
jgi:hypothetical protein